jgi:mono/diheme cytochrome c family protein
VQIPRVIALALVWIAGCWSLDEDRFGPQDDASTTSAEASSDDAVIDATSESGDEGGVIASGLPCEIDAFLAARCRGCHVPGGAGPMPLVTHDDLVAASFVDPSLRVVDRVVARIQNEASPMPPAPGTPASADEIAMIEAWIADGTPQGACDAGGGDSTGGDDGEDPFDVEPKCSSGSFWDDDDDESPLMHPGAACITCHDAERADDPDDDDIPDLLVGGTVYPTAHEPTDCNGESGVTVVLESMATGTRVEITTNSAGNAELHRSQAPAGLDAPFLVKLVRGDVERVMPIPAPSGNCNSCHTQDGTMGAPGRVVAP